MLAQMSKCPRQFPKGTEMGSTGQVVVQAGFCWWPHPPRTEQQLSHPHLLWPEVLPISAETTNSPMPTSKTLGRATGDISPVVKLTRIPGARIPTPMLISYGARKGFHLPHLQVQVSVSSRACERASEHVRSLPAELYVPSPIKETSSTQLQE